MGAALSSDGGERAENQFKFDVFLSFRVEDSELSFTDELNRALTSARIKTFKDDKEHQTEEDSMPTELLTVIQASKISLLIFSRNYAASKCCLEQLVKIMECRESIEQMVFPIFYRIDPSDVRKQTGSLKEAFTQHEKCFSAEEVSRWRHALTAAGNLSGWPVMEDSNAAECIETIVKEVSTSLQTVFEFDGSQIQEIGRLNRMVKLKIYNLEEVKNRKEAERANLMGKKYLSKLELKWSLLRLTASTDKNVLGGLEPHPNLRSLTITNYLVERFPLWLMKMSSIDNKGDLLLHHNLVEIKLDSCPLIEQLPILGQLPFLKVLEMEFMGSVKCIDKGFYGSSNQTSSSFPALQKLSLGNMNRLAEWMMPEATVVVFPCLKELHVKDCLQLETIPSRAPSLLKLQISFLKSLPDQIQHLSTLTDLSVQNFNDIEALPEWLGNLSSLEELEIRECRNLKFLPTEEAMRRLTSLQSLTVKLCPLSSNCAEPSGSEWFKVEHLLEVFTD